MDKPTAADYDALRRIETRIFKVEAGGMLRPTAEELAMRDKRRAACGGVSWDAYNGWFCDPSGEPIWSVDQEGNPK